MVNNKMKKTYITPNSLTVVLNMRSHLLVDSGTSVTVNPTNEVSTNFTKENSNITDINIWDEEW